METEFRLDKSAFSVAPLHDHMEEKEFWRAASPEQRMEAVEYLRRTAYGHAATTARLQRILAVVEQTWR